MSYGTTTTTTMRPAMKESYGTRPVRAANRKAAVIQKRRPSLREAYMRRRVR